MLLLVARGCVAGVLRPHSRRVAMSGVAGAGARERDDATTPFVVTFVTGNAGKLREMLAVAGDALPLRSEPVDLPELQGTPEEIACAKSSTAAKRLKGAALVEDTCLAFEALGGMPGPYVKWFLDAVGAKGLHTLLAGFDNKRASAICTFGYCPGPDEEPILFQVRIMRAHMRTHSKHTELTLVEPVRVGRGLCPV